MIDIHSHILPGVDDGAKTMDDALDIARRELEGGTCSMFATSHVMDKHDVESLPMRAQRLQELIRTLEEKGIGFDVYPGAEVFPFPGVLKAIDEGAPLTLNGSRFVLLDLPLLHLPNDFESFIFSLQSRGLVPILAHPERVAEFQQDPEKLRPFVERDVPIQMNAGSVLGQYGPQAMETAFYIMGRRWPQFMASDSHRASRSPKLQSAVRALTGKVEDRYLELLTCSSPHAVVTNGVLPSRPAEPPRPKKRFWANLLRRRAAV